MPDGPFTNRFRTWAVLTGAVTGLVIGIVVGATTDIPFAPEIGLLLGGLVGWLLAIRVRR